MKFENESQSFAKLCFWSFRC